MTGQNKAPLVSVIIPCYNHARFLPEAIESALSQTHLSVEVIVVDDGSRDNTAEVAARFPDVMCLRQQNQGLAGARNAGLRASCGEYVVFLDADDRLTPSAIEAHLSCFEQHPEAGFVVGDIDQINLNGGHVDSPRWPLLRGNYYEELLRVNHVANTIAVMFRRSLLEQLGGFNCSCSPAEDYEILLRAARLSPSAHHRNVVAQYRRHPSTLSRQGVKMLRAMREVMRLQWPIANQDSRLREAWCQGDRYWRDHFGVAAVKEIVAHLRRLKVASAAAATGGLIRHLRARVLLLPYVLAERAVERLGRHLHNGRQDVTQTRAVTSRHRVS
jgi:glycosyltransferase involved in cell wall biosynthesis